MFKKTPDETTQLEEAIDSVFTDLSTHTAETKEYAASLEQLVKLYKLKDQDRPPRISPDTLALIAGNLLGIFVIVGHERANVVTSKALSFVTKLK